MSQKPGGIILKIEALDKIFNKKDTIGVALAINKPIANSNANTQPVYDVNINVHRCFWDTVSDKTTIRAVKEEGDYVRTASNRAARLGDAVEADPSRYEFEFKKEMIEKDFAFGFLTKDQYGTLKKHKAKEIFISGAIIDFGTIGSFRYGGRYFTFKAEPYEKNLKTNN